MKSFPDAAAAGVTIIAIMTPTGRCRYDITLQPISGKAVPLYKGEVLRLIQVEGEQCVDFNCFNLYDYKERMYAIHLRISGSFSRNAIVRGPAPSIRAASSRSGGIVLSAPYMTLCDETIPSELWADLKAEGFIREDAPVPGCRGQE